jgi:hypothetical protein
VPEAMPADQQVTDGESGPIAITAIAHGPGMAVFAMPP